MSRDTTPTNRRAYERPEIGDDWAQAWDDLVEDLDGAALFDEPGEIDTNNLSDDAVTAAKIAAAAVTSSEIGDGAVGVDELANALGTSDTEPIPGTTHFEEADAESVNTESIGTDYHYAGGYDGSGPDARLDNALSAANRGDRILLENATYSDNRTIEDRHNLSGTGMRNGTEITGSWDIGTSQLDHVRLSDVGITSGGFNVISHFSGNTGSSITVTGDRSVIGPAFGGNMSLIFESGTSNNIIDSVAEVAVTDNGSNTVGDIS